VSLTDLHEDVLDDPAALAAGDPKGMLRDVATSGAQVRSAVAATNEAGLDALIDGGRPRAIVIAGMGGSGISGDVLAAVAGAGCPVPLVVYRGFGLPGWVGAADLVTAVSCSGSTEETLSAAEEAVRRGARLFGIGAESSPLADIATQASAAYVSVSAPSSGQPRAALWSLAIPLVILADRLALLSAPMAALDSTADLLDEVSQRCRPGSETFVNPAKSLAVNLAGSLPMIWGSSALAGVASYRFACQLAENAKYPAISGVLPEAGHNQIVTVDGPFAGAAADEDDLFRDRVDEPGGTAKLRLVVLQDTDEDPRLAARRVAVTEIARDRGVATVELVSEGATSLERLASLVALGDYASVYLALLLGIDPTAIAPIVDLKARVAQ
jgi:glucose/mannose-6-phosphate isomerase